MNWIKTTQAQVSVPTNHTIIRLRLVSGECLGRLVWILKDKEVWNKENKSNQPQPLWEVQEPFKGRKGFVCIENLKH